MLTRYVLPLASVAMLGFAMYQLSQARPQGTEVAPPVEPAKSPYESQLAGAGIIEPESENISIGTHVAGVVREVYVEVGMKVRTGDKLFSLDERALIAEEQTRLANLLSAQAHEEKLAKSPREEELPPLDAKIAQAKAHLEEQEKLYERYIRLRSSGAVSEEEYVKRESGLATAKALYLQAQSQRNLIGAGAWEQDKLVARAATSSAKALLEQTRTERARLTVLTPLGRSGEGPSVKLNVPAMLDVLQVNIRPGEFVGTTGGTPLVVLGNLNRLHVRVDIDENDIARFDPKFNGVAKPRGNPEKAYPLKFVRVEPYVIPKRSLTGGNLERVDTRVLQVIYSIDTQGASLYVGQQMDVFLNTRVAPSQP